MNPDVFLYIMDSTTIHPLYKKDQSQRIYNGTIYMDSSHHHSKSYLLLPFDDRNSREFRVGE